MWILPTKNRIEKLKRFLASANEAGTFHPGIIAMDKADYEANKKEYLELELPKNWILRETDAISMGDKFRELWPYVKAGDWVGILNDDFHVVTKDWDKKLISYLDGKNFVNSNDRWMSPVKATTATAWSMPLLNAVGFPVFPPGMQHLFIDDTWENLGRATGCWRQCMNVIVEHHHVLKGQGQEDETHRAVYNSKSWDKDKAVYDLFIKHDFANAVKAIVDLQDCIPSQRYNPAPNKPAEEKVCDAK